MRTTRIFPRPDLSADQYHADELGHDRPSLSASIAKHLITKSPLHAWTEHPKLNPGYERKTEEKYELGTAFHSAILEGIDVVTVVNHDSWRKDEAKEQRDEIRAAGKIPLLTHQYDELQRMLNAVQTQLANVDADPLPLTAGKPEQTIVWEENGVLCRALVDWVRDDFTVIDDVKTTKASASPESWKRTMYGFGGDIQVAMHRRAVRAATGVTPDFRFVVVECQPPYALSLVDLAPSALALAEARVDKALEIWAQCLKTGVWPGYDRRVHSIEMPSYMEWDWLEREARDAA